MAKSSNSLQKLSPLRVLICLLLLKVCYTSDVLSLNLSSLPSDPITRELTLNGGSDRDQLGFSVDTAGDMDNDGLKDLIIGVPSMNNYQGAVYVIYGGESSSRDLGSILSDPATKGFIITGEAVDDWFGYSANTAGDLNKDGYDDIIIGAPKKDGSKGAVYVIYGGPRALDLNISSKSLDPVTTGFIIKGNDHDDMLGSSVNAAGDVNNDGFPDIIIGASSKKSSQGVAYVIYGREKSSMAHIDLSLITLDPAITGFMIPKNDDITLATHQKADEVKLTPPNSRQLQSCGGNCRTCAGSACDSCYSDYSLSGGSCVYTGSGSGGGGSSGPTCPSNCDSCSSSSTCTTCSGLYLLYAGDCYTACPAKTYLSSSTTCSTCSNGCDSCTNPTTCTKCSGSYFLFNDTCTQNCPLTTFPDTGTGTGVCEACPSDCDICTDSSTCTKCSGVYNLYNSQCTQNCPVTTFADTGVCQPCPSNCDNCASSSVCIICTIPYNLLMDQCIQTCPLGMFAGGGICKDCPTGCAQCTDLLTCTVCASSYYLFLNQCLTVCPPATFSSDSTGACEDCPVHCTSCGSKTACKVCDNGYTLSDSVCGVPSSLQSQARAVKTVSSAVIGAGTVLCVGSPTFPITALVSKIVQNTRYLNLTVTDELAEIYKTWNTNMISWDPPNVVSKLDNFKTSPVLFSQYGVGSSFMTNFWPTFMTIMVGLGVFVTCFMAKQLCERGKYQGRFYAVVKKLFAGSFNFVIVQAYGCLDEILFYLVLDTKTNPYHEVFSWTSLFCAIGFVGLGCSFIFLNMRVVYKYQTIKAEGLVKQDMSGLEVFNQKNKYWELFYSEFNDEDFWSQSTLALLIIRSALSSLIVAVFYDYPLMQTVFLVMLDGVAILFVIIKKPFVQLRGRLAQYYFETITLLVHICTFTLALQETFPVPSGTLREVLCTSMMYLNTTLIAGSLFFMGIEIYDAIRLKQESQKYKNMGIEEASSTVQNTISTTEIMTTSETVQAEIQRSPVPVGYLETSSLFSGKNNNTSLSGIRIKPARTLDLSMNPDDSVISQDIEADGNERNQQRARPLKISRRKPRTTSKEKPQQKVDGFLLRNPARHLRDLK